MHVFWPQPAWYDFTWCLSTCLLDLCYKLCPFVALLHLWSNTVLCICWLCILDTLCILDLSHLNIYCGHLLPPSGSSLRIVFSLNQCFVWQMLRCSHTWPTCPRFVEQPWPTHYHVQEHSYATLERLDSGLLGTA